MAFLFLDLFGILFQVALKRGEKVRCFVDERGCYTRNLGHNLEGKNVLDEGNNLVLQMFKRDVVYSHQFKHRYPYDWRTKQVSCNPIKKLYLMRIL